MKPLSGWPVLTNANDGDYHSATFEPDSLEACAENRFCGPGHICCEGICTVFIFAEYFDVVFFGLRAFVESYDLFGMGLNFWK